MKKWSFLGLIASFSLLTLSGCLKDTCKNESTFKVWTPIYLSDDAVRQTPQYEAARPLKNPGKMYFYGNLMFVNEIKEGVHIIDNSNPEAPVNKGFIKIVGNVDIAIKDDKLYADSYMDLITLDISDYTRPRLTDRKLGVFQGQFWRDPSKGWLVDYKEETVSDEIDCNDPRFTSGGNFFIEGDRIFSLGNVSRDVFSSFSNGATGAAPAGVGGSMARFTLKGEHLYCLNLSELKAFSVSNRENPVLLSTTHAGWGIETIFPYKNFLFIGAANGMFVFDVTQPDMPRMASNFSHSRACDPVVVQNDLAYVTLRTGATCGGTDNVMLVLDVSQVTAPKLLKTYPMTNPKGLAIADNTLYLCDEGLKVFNAQDWSKIDQNKVAHIVNFDAYDVIPFDWQNKRVAMVVGADGFYQFDVTNPRAPVQLSRLPIQK